MARKAKKKSVKLPKAAFNELFGVTPDMQKRIEQVKKEGRKYMVVNGVLHDTTTAASGLNSLMQLHGVPPQWAIDELERTGEVKWNPTQKQFNDVKGKP